MPRSPRVLLATLLAATLAAIAALAWFGWGFLEEERVAESHRTAEILDIAAGEIAAEMSVQLAESSDRLQARLLRRASPAVEMVDGVLWVHSSTGAYPLNREGATTVHTDAYWLARAMEQAWSDGLSGGGYRIAAIDQRPVLILWRSSGPATAALAAFAHPFFSGPLRPGYAYELTDAGDNLVTGDAAAPEASVDRPVGGSQYGWTLRLWPADPDALLAASAQRRRLVVAMIAAMVLFLLGAASFAARLIRREAQTSRLQADFVAAVSHEFRSPLTSLRQLAEMLEMGRVPNEDRRQTYYRVLCSETARLQRLVETLLNFGRMEASAQRYRFEDLDAARLIRSVVREIEPQARDSGKEIETRGPESGVRVRGDADALALAVRNLLDNAIKYSPGHPKVWVECSSENARTVIRVVDRGLGIARAEQGVIFRKFVRGQAAVDSNVKGTGVGLAMVRHILAAHGAEIRLESEPGSGSTFTLLFPVT